MDRVFVDTSAWKAIADQEDAFAPPAADYYRQLLDERQPLLTTNFVLDELYTLLTRVAGLRQAAQFGDALLVASHRLRPEEIAMRRVRKGGIVDLRLVPATPRQLLIYTVDPLVEERAWLIFKKYGSRGFTYTDATSVALMLMLGHRRVFAFDQGFDILGLQRVPHVPLG